MEITIGVEEELMIIDPATREIVTDPPAEIFARATEKAKPHRVVGELLRSQIETNSKVCGSIDELHQSLRETRAAVIEAAATEQTAVIGSSTHPWARWQDQHINAGAHYQQAQAALQDSVRQFFIGGMHVHAGFSSREVRIRTMGAILGHLPLLLALSASSPFHAGRLTGLKSYRQSAIAAIPRTGSPPTLKGWKDFQMLTARYRAIGAIEHASELRWDIRPSAHYPTIELRICDICPRIEDAAAIAALYACLIRRAATQIESGHTPPASDRVLLEEGRWRAQRYGTFALLPDQTLHEVETIGDRTATLAEELAEHADALQCEAQIAHAIEIGHTGSSADRQEDTYREAKLTGAGENEALRAVVDHIRAETERI